jgi:hypothetical protein
VSETPDHGITYGAVHLKQQRRAAVSLNAQLISPGWDTREHRDISRILHRTCISVAVWSARGTLRSAASPSSACIPVGGGA